MATDSDAVTDYRTDALVHQGHPTIALSLALAEQMTLLPARVRDLRLPLLVQHGTDDRICPPEGSRALETSVGTDDLTVRWYDGFWHEIYHEPEREQRASEATQGRARARWPGLVEECSPTTRSTSGRST